MVHIELNVTEADILTALKALIWTNRNNIEIGTRDQVATAMTVLWASTDAVVEMRAAPVSVKTTEEIANVIHRACRERGTFLHTEVYGTDNTPPVKVGDLAHSYFTMMEYIAQAASNAQKEVCCE